MRCGVERQRTRVCQGQQDEALEVGEFNMKARVKVFAHGPKLVIELPHDVIVGLQVQEGDEVDVEIGRPSHEPLLARESLATLRKYRGRLPAGFKFDRHDANDPSSKPVKTD
jgi:antitoxin MazE